MRTFIKSVVVLGMCWVAGVKTAGAQVSGTVHNQPASFYYVPDWEMYYDKPAQQFIYFDGKSWVRSDDVPDWFTDKSINVVDKSYNGSDPYVQIEKDRKLHPSRNRAAGGPRYRKDERSIVKK